MTAPHTRWILRKDWPAVLRMDPSVTEESLNRLRSQRNSTGMVVEDATGTTIVAYVVYLLHPSSVQIAHLVVDARHRGAGIGRSIVEHMIRKAATHRRKTLVMHVPERETGSLLFLRACGFRAVTYDRDAEEVEMTLTVARVENHV
jgi:ribosomal protein S18 acetylase RimI-like enzyme